MYLYFLSVTIFNNSQNFQSLFYFTFNYSINLFNCSKFVLSIKPETVQPFLRSGGNLLKRELSSGQQNYDTDRNIWPDNQPLPKIDGLYQTSGEAQYVNDIPIKSNEVFCAVTIADKIGVIEKIQLNEAMVNILSIFMYK